MGLDGTFTESVTLKPVLFSDVLSAVWEKYGKLGCIPSQLRIAKIAPIHKKGDKTLPQNYRTITIISQVRKIVDKALKIGVRRVHAFHPAQLGFRENVGTDTAITRITNLNSMGIENTSILDLKKAYDTV